MSEQLNKLYEEYKKLNKESSYSRKSTSIPKMTPYKINIELENITAENTIYKTFDFTMIKNMYDKKNDFDVPIIYEEMYRLIKRHLKKTNNAIITYSPDISISLATTCAIAEKYLVNNCGIYKSDLKIIILTSKPRINNKIDKHNIKEYSNTLLSSLLDTIENSYFNHNVKIYPEQIIMLGINEDYCTENDNVDILNDLGVEFYTLQKIKNIGIRKIINSIKYIDEPIHLIFDMSSTSFKTAPCVFRYLNKTITSPDQINGFEINELKFLFTEFAKMNIVGLDITGFDTRKNNDMVVEKALNVTYEIARLPMKKIFNIKEKSLNIFNECSKFLIFRPYHQEDEDDSGWYIFRNIAENETDEIMTNEMKNKLIEEIDDLIVPFNPNKPFVTDTAIDFTEYSDYDENSEDTILLATTTMEEQNQKIFIEGGTDINEKVLYSGEKTRMLFEIL